MSTPRSTEQIRADLNTRTLYNINQAGEYLRDEASERLTADVPGLLARAHVAERERGEVCAALAESVAREQKLRERIETLAALWKRRNRQLSEGYCSDQLRAVLAGDTGQRPEGPVLRDVPHERATWPLDDPQPAVPVETTEDQWAGRPND